MKKCIPLLIAFFCCIQLVNAQNEFITTWKTDNFGESNDDQITIPTFAGETYDYTVDWGDGTTDTNVTGDITHTYAAIGTYTVKISGLFPRIYFHGGLKDRNKILTIEQWGDNPWSSMVFAFSFCSNLTITNPSIDSPNLSNTDNITGIFNHCYNFNGDVSNWDVSTIQSMQVAFREARAFNQDLSNWDVSDTFNMISMFEGADDFDQSLGAWDIGSLTSAEHMFRYTGMSTASYDQTMIGWATDSSGTPGDAIDDIPTNILFDGGNSFYCSSTPERLALEGTYSWTISDGGPTEACIENAFITTWKTDNPGATNDNQITIPTWGGETYDYTVHWGDGSMDTNVTGNIIHTYAQPGTYTVKIYGVFPRIRFAGTGANDKDKIETVEQWGHIQWSSMAFAFDGCVNLNVTATDAPDLSMATRIDNMFRNCHSMTGGIGHWDVSSIDNMNQTFNNASNFNSDIGGWNTANVQTLTRTFSGANSFNQSLADWDLTNASNLSNMLDQTNMSTENYDATLIGWADDSSGNPSDGIDDIPTGMSFGAAGSTYCDAQQAWDTLDTTYNWNISDSGLDPACNQSLFITTWKTDEPGTSNDTQITIPTFLGETYNYTVYWGDGTSDSGVTGNIVHTYTNPGTYTVVIEGTFPRIYFNNEADKLKIQTIENWGDNPWSSMENAFFGCVNLNITNPDIDNPDLSNVSSLANMFNLCQNFNGAISNWDVSNIEVMDEMFREASIFNQDLSQWNVSGVTSMIQVFREASAFNQDISQWHVNEVTNMDGMFLLASDFNQDIGGWNVGNVTNMINMFRSATSFDQDLGNWDISKVTDMTDMFRFHSLSTVNYDLTIMGWATDSSGTPADGDDDIPSGIIFNGGGSTFCLSEPLIEDLEIAYNWGITDGGPDPDCNGAFITTWKTDNMGPSGNNQITIPTVPGELYNYSIDWGDGSSDVGITGDITHTYAVPGIYTVSITGLFPRISFRSSSAPDYFKLLTIEQWGDNLWTSMEAAFWGCHNLRITNPDIDTPNLAFTTSLKEMFSICQSFNTDISNWDVSTITDMSGMFQNSPAFDQNLGAWDIGNLTDASLMFDGAGLSTSKYDLTIMHWATDISGDPTDGIDDIPTDLNFDGGTSAYCVSEPFWTELGTSYNWTILDAGLAPDCMPEFITTWQVDNIVNPIVIPIYVGESYNYTIDWGDGTVETGITGGIIHNYTSTGTYTIRIKGLFPGIFISGLTTGDYLLTIEQWGDNPWTRMEGAYVGCDNLNITNPSIDEPNLTNVSNLSNMFFGCPNFNGDVTNWDVSTIKDLTNMFRDATLFNQDIGNWDVSGVESMQHMFAGATSFNQDIGNWDVSSTTSMGFMFQDALAFDQSLGNWNLNADGVFMNAMFYGAGLSLNNYDDTIIGWATDSSGIPSDGVDDIPSNVPFNGGSSLFCNSKDERSLLMNAYGWSIFDGGLAPGCLDGFVTIWKTDVAGQTGDYQLLIPTHPGGVYDYTVDWGDGGVQPGLTGDALHIYSHPGTYVITITGLFPRIYFNDGGDKDKLQSIEQWGDNPWTSMENAFYGCSLMEINDTESPNLSNVTNTNRMFERCSALNSDLSNWDVSAVESMVRMFAYASSFDQNIDDWDVSSVQYFASMFFRATSYNQSMDNWVVTSAETMFRMFGEATSFNQDIGGWEVGSVDDMELMFEEATAFNQDLSQWDVSQVTYMSGMFYGATSFDQDLGLWDIGSVTSMDEMFYDVTLSTNNYDNMLIGWSTDSSGVDGDGIDDIPMDVTFHGGFSTYCAGSDARFLLNRPQVDGGYNWTITDGLTAPGCGVFMEISLFMEGPSLNPVGGEEDLMRDSLRSEGALPATSPYPDGMSVDPTIFDTTGPDAIVDWVWVELRDAIDPTIVRTGFSALLQRDGDIISAEGAPFLAIGFLADDYYIAVHHRNHIGIMTANVISFAPLTPTAIDLATDVNAIEGGINAVTLLPNGKYAVFSGDFDDNGQIQTTDLNALIPNLGGSGYSPADLNMDGQIQTTDINLLLIPNIGKGQSF